MERIFKYFWVVTCLALYVSCSSDEEAGNEKTPLKYIKTVYNKLDYSEKWTYDNKNHVIKIVRSNDTTSSYEYNNDGELVKAVTYYSSEPNIKTAEFRLEYQPNKVIVNIKRFYPGNHTISRKEYILDHKGKPIKMSESESYHYIYNQADDNVTSVIYSSKDYGDFLNEKYLYDNKRNLLLNYPVGFRLVNNDEHINENNVIWGKFFTEEYSKKYEYDADGYITNDSNYYYTY